MLEVNDFNAIRISIASPEQIRSWSYGEVTKPETINYRTLKPEKDGLFCERIFGPTKDWECYCGKYKRVRFKGIVCDKCGVEVARAKVRRERMGHIELASPVSHIWYFKGTPSRLGLLLDISPRNLEKILYFASYIVVSVDDTLRKGALEGIDEEVARHATGLEERTSAQQQEIEQRVVGEEERLEADKQSRFAALEAEGLSAEDSADRRSQIEVEIEREKEQLRGAANAEIDELARKMNEEIEAKEAELHVRRDTIEKLAPMQLLSDTQYRETLDLAGPIFKAGMGAEAVLEIIQALDLDALAKQLRQDVHSSSSMRRKKAIKRLRIVEAFRRSGNHADWMVLTVLPVLPPDLRPMVQLDGGRFATSDLNDLYRRVINRNNRLKRLLELGAPEIIIRNEKRMLQEAVDALIDNGRRGRAVAGSTNHKLKSLSDMLRGKQGRFRQNLLGKRVDYSGRSVIVVGPELKLSQCGLPKKMALELFKPFVMRKLVERGYAPNIKSAKRVVERARPQVWDVLEEVIEGHPVLLNRAPTLHRLGIQAFDPVLVEGSAIQIHPLVCTAFNADFDGDQMAVHVPLSEESQHEARELMLSSHNLLSPADGSPIVSPTKDMVVGMYYLTVHHPGAKGEYQPANAKKGTRERGVFSSFDEVCLAREMGRVDLQAGIKLQVNQTDFPESFVEAEGHAWGELLETTVGRVIFNAALPLELRYFNDVLDKGKLKTVVARCFFALGQDRTAEVVDQIKYLGFHYATVSGLTMAISDIHIPKEKAKVLAETDKEIEEIERQYRRGLITDQEQYDKNVEAWSHAMTRVEEAVRKELDPYGPVYMMAQSGAAKGSFQQIRQIAGMRGLMADPSGRIIELPIRSNFREGLSVLEYFISTHGARKGLADTALRTADSGYLTRRLIDVAQDVIIRDFDCGTTQGVVVRRPDERTVGINLTNRILGRSAAEDIVDPETGEIFVPFNEEIDEAAVARIEALKLPFIRVRSPLTCELRYGLCAKCYGRNLATALPVEQGAAVGIIGAQSIGEPGTQLTMRTFHTGGVAGEDITQGLPRVEELFEARVPKGVAIITAIEGKVEVERGEPTKIRVISSQVFNEPLQLPDGFDLVVDPDTEVGEGTVIARRRPPKGKAAPAVTAEALAALPEEERVLAPASGRLILEGDQLLLRSEEREDAEYVIPAAARIRVEDGQMVKAGEQLTEGAVNPQDILQVLGREAVQEYLVEQVQQVYRSQGVSINDKHIEVISRQMLRKVRVDTPGDTDLLAGDIVDRFTYEEVNQRVLAEGGEPATAQPVLLGVTKASLSTESFLAAASFQETTRVLTQAASEGQKDRLLGLKENVIIGKLIPAGTGFLKRLERQRQAQLAAEAAEQVQDEDAALEAAARNLFGAPADLDGEPSSELPGVPSEAPEAAVLTADLPPENEDGAAPE
jgi:DNA-directed RNA polymerase subunit beta'